MKNKRLTKGEVLEIYKNYMKNYPNFTYPDIIWDEFYNNLSESDWIYLDGETFVVFKTQPDQFKFTFE